LFNTLIIGLDQRS